MTSLRLTLIANAATAATRQAAFPLDEGLESQGLAKATALAVSLGRVDGAWTGPARRARQTAEALGLQAAVDPALADIDLGRWAGRSLAEIAAEDPQGLGLWTSDPDAAPHDGESVTRLLARVGSWLEAAQPSQGRIVAVTHAAVIRAAMIIILDANPRAFWRIDVEPLACARLQATAGRWTLRSLG
ncbi:histidine phosphatase family protein [Acidisoma silvae]|uniref:Histidine phosphatase family protein n=1 Tax=Acidisoma silvae TaxID=2802396 RepID=A0A963YS35_9PROT|nr:histidine phosphatase family protein [Acidisoma silvae]MCB8876073.1 histidine phosphatase family protein [Acidisoma silvae]